MFLLGLNAQNVPFYMPANGLEAYYPMDSLAQVNGNLTVFDASANQRHGIFYGAPSLALDKDSSSNEALYMDGIDDWGSFPPFDFPTGYTISFWVKINSSYRQTLFAQNTPTPNWPHGNATAMASFDGSNHNVWYETFPGCSVGSNWPANTFSYQPYSDQWTHLVFTAEPWQPRRIYANGVEVMVDNSNIHNYFWCNDPSARFKLGMWWTADPAHPNGTFDELAMWSRPLSAREVQNMYSEQLNPHNASVNADGCVVCDQYQSGEVFSLDSGSTFYTAVDKGLLESMRDNGADLSKVCVSLVTD
ncbi:MAG: LamG domain-containing protein, partial [Flavobacteriia bacterium]|nr:LamG domain-containing protein [Flavobacteriia bacterium]